MERSLVTVCGIKQHMVARSCIGHAKRAKVSSDGPHCNSDESIEVQCFLRGGLPLWSGKVGVFSAWPVLQRVLNCHPLPVLSPLIFFRLDQLYEPYVVGYVIWCKMVALPSALAARHRSHQGAMPFPSPLYFFLLSCAAVLPALPGIICLASTTVIYQSLADAPMLAILSHFCICVSLQHSAHRTHRPHCPPRISSVPSSGGFFTSSKIALPFAELHVVLLADFFFHFTT